MPSVRAFLQDIGELAADKELFARHLYLYPGNVLYPDASNGADQPLHISVLATSLARPGGNQTGINFFLGELTAKRLGLLRELVPGAARIGAAAKLFARASRFETDEGRLQNICSLHGLPVSPSGNSPVGPHLR